MRYEKVLQGRFINRPNRFIAQVELGGETAVCHVKNTGRCRELLVPGATVWVEERDDPGRRTKYDLICVEKGDRLINMDSAAPNRVFGEYLAAGRLVPEPELIRPETVFGSSRIDFYVESRGQGLFCEVKGVTLEDRGVVSFPDAPTERGVRHLRELVRAVEAGFGAYAVFVVQMEGARFFRPNRETHPEFADALAQARDAGVKVLALSCAVTPNSMEITTPLEVRV